MAKRANPYTEDFIPQSKVHFGVKQFNNNEDRLQKVYEKTLQLLFKGANKLASSQETVSNEDTLINNKKDNMKQLFIGKNGALENSSVTLVLWNPDKHVIKSQCTCARAVRDSKCAYCEVKLCQCSRHLCVTCTLIFCSQCSLIGSEGGEICVSCYH